MLVPLVSHLLDISSCCVNCVIVHFFYYIPVSVGSVGDPDPNPQDPHVFGPFGSGSISQR
jgi:hypothetical protein